MKLRLAPGAASLLIWVGCGSAASAVVAGCSTESADSDGSMPSSDLTGDALAPSGGGSPGAGGGGSSTVGNTGGGTNGGSGGTNYTGMDAATKQDASTGAGSDATVSNTDAALSGWTLAWSDEFDGTGLPNAKNWGYEVGLVRNSEAQYYTNARTQNARQENGMLVIEAIKEDFTGAHYTSASLTTKGTHQFLNGRLEVRAKLPGGRGTWPAIWLLGINEDMVGWPQCGEVDMMENVGFEPNTIHYTIHTGSDPSGNHNAALATTAPYDNFHVYALEWTQDALDLFIDGTKALTYPNDHAGNAGSWPFAKPVYLILNLAIGGNWGGQQGIDDATFPHFFYIDYVRYYT